MGEIMEVAWFAILRNDHRANACSGIGAVSYTHLTLPTILDV